MDLYFTTHFMSLMDCMYLFTFGTFGKAKLAAENLNDLREVDGQQQEPVDSTLKSQHMFQSNKQIEL